MFARRAVVAATLTIMLTPAPSASAQPVSDWRDDAGWGSVTVSADRKSITVCDLSDDGRAVRVEYATTYLQQWTVVDSNGARWGCGSDSAFFSRITVFKLCEGAKYGPCRPSVWVSRAGYLG
ncbi:hypothetical protein [Nonomuraea rubra]|uniref:Ricin B lectin domain-containing protein n=1 Tax=Nonomuraea rubra TaxID=46180 RepID=A0A7X0NNZ8_9ACTN|nr:hypothetical protein [Nonomuraea rubra]MBB6546923.1 hypothetical protein [Nonomuraea rubra]